MTPEQEVSVEPEEAKEMGAFVEDAISLEEAMESSKEKEVE
jgi:hypothetical protein